jgi:hypothetical protein
MYASVFVWELFETPPKISGDTCSIHGGKRGEEGRPSRAILIASPSFTTARAGFKHSWLRVVKAGEDSLQYLARRHGGGSAAASSSSPLVK